MILLIFIVSGGLFAYDLGLHGGLLTDKIYGLGNFPLIGISGQIQILNKVNHNDLDDITHGKHTLGAQVFYGGKSGPILLKDNAAVRFRIISLIVHTTKLYSIRSHFIFLFFVYKHFYILF